MKDDTPPTCLQCGKPLTLPDGTVSAVCPACGQPQELANKRMKQTR